MIREPYGCFEQCSSVTYPLVMLLKYLKWVPRTDKVLKMIKEAEDKLIRGYKKLISYEAETGG